MIKKQGNVELVDSLKRDIHFLLPLLVSGNHTLYEIINFYDELLHRMEKNIDTLEENINEE